MRIVAISPDRGHLKEIEQVLGPWHKLTVLEGTVAMLPPVVAHEVPDLILLETEPLHAHALAQVEQVTTLHQDMALALMCAAPSFDFLVEAMRAGARELLPSPIEPPALEAAVQRIDAKLRAARGRTTGQLLAFMSSKGGSGATFVATNLGYQLAQNKRVLLIDLNLQFGDALACVYEPRPATTLANVAREIDRLDASFLAASAVQVAPGFSVLAAPDDPSQAVEITPAHIEAVMRVALHQYDFVLVDAARPIDPITVKVLDPANKIFLVMQADLSSIRNSKKLLGVFRSLGYGQDKVELVVNRFERDGDISLADIEQALGKFVMRPLPNSYGAVHACVTRGAPLATTSRRNPVVRSLAEFARALNPQLASAAGFWRMFSRVGT